MNGKTSSSISFQFIPLFGRCRRLFSYPRWSASSRAKARPSSLPFDVTREEEKGQKCDAPGREFGWMCVMTRCRREKRILARGHPATFRTCLSLVRWKEGIIWQFGEMGTGEEGEDISRVGQQWDLKRGTHSGCTMSFMHVC